MSKRIFFLWANMTIAVVCMQDCGWAQVDSHKSVPATAPASARPDAVGGQSMLFPPADSSAYVTPLDFSKWMLEFEKEKKALIDEASARAEKACVPHAVFEGLQEKFLILFREKEGLVDEAAARAEKACVSHAMFEGLQDKLLNVLIGLILLLLGAVAGFLSIGQRLGRLYRLGRHLAGLSMAEFERRYPEKPTDM